MTCGELGVNTRPPAALDHSLHIPITEHTLGSAQRPREGQGREGSNEHRGAAANQAASRRVSSSRF